MEPQQTAQPSQAPAAAPAATPAPEPKGLEKVYRDFNVEADAASFRPETPAPQAPAPQYQQPQQQPAPSRLDPFSPEFPAHIQAIANAAAQANSALHQTQGKLTALEQQLHQRQVEADLKQAVGVVTEKSGIDPDIAEVALESKARKDPRFLQIWNNRSKNPAAFKAALEAVSGEFKERFAVRQDPQLVENQRAIRASQQQMATTTKESDQDRWAGMSPEERAVERQRIMRHG